MFSLGFGFEMPRCALPPALEIRRTDKQPWERRVTTVIFVQIELHSHNARAVTKSGTGTWDSGLGDVGLGDTRGLGDVINKQHLTFALNL